jgi:hypothetical protein
MPLTLELPTIEETLDAGEAVIGEAIITQPLPPLPAEVPSLPNYGGEMLVLAVLVTIVFMLIRAMMTLLPYVVSIVVGVALLKYFVL